MKLIGKHSSVLVALSIFCLPTLLIVYFQLAQWQQQKHMEEELENDQLQTISISQSELKWYKLNKEAIVEGKLFDVKKIHQEGNTVILTGLFDEKETEIKNNLGIIRKAESEKKKNSELANHYFSILLFPIRNSIDIPIPYQLTKKSFFTEASCQITSISYSIITPPPEA